MAARVLRKTPQEELNDFEVAFISGNLEGLSQDITALNRSSAQGTSKGHAVLAESGKTCVVKRVGT